MQEKKKEFKWSVKVTTKKKKKKGRFYMEQRSEKTSWKRGCCGGQGQLVAFVRMYGGKVIK